ncbi:hypothetical protein [Capnocytophaga granulosa]|uniref:hypothetical protein n=1 Tax=Capnocytophaga granulosa TaxID=45242 RepID=UPI0023F2B386|nr:hypothetical protein [Capnocytophaga granulosa]
MKHSLLLSCRSPTKGCVAKQKECPRLYVGISTSAFPLLKIFGRFLQEGKL